MVLSLALSACGGGASGVVSSDGGPVNDREQDLPVPDGLFPQISCSAHIYCREITNYPAITGARPGTRESLAPVTSTYTGRTYDVSVYLPATYSESTDPYPVIYSLDGDRRFLEQADEIDNQQKEVIPVSTHADSSRDTDYLYYEANGTAQGGQDFYHYVVFELIPFIEVSFRIDSSRRALEGHSHGGTFVVYSLFTDRLDAQYFKTFVAQGPSIWIHEESLNNLKTQLSQRFADLDIHYFSYDLDHSSMHRPAFADFLHDHY